ncbi:hypothetical protein PIB30_067483, partial [Stylosanthes scabra]|nr:hypothetical protein [Stylosanthes scabra]
MPNSSSSPLSTPMSLATIPLSLGVYGYDGDDELRWLAKTDKHKQIGNNDWLYELRQRLPPSSMVRNGDKAQQQRRLCDA